MDPFRVSFMTLKGPFRTARVKWFATMKSGAEAIEKHAAAGGYSDVRMVEDVDPGVYRFTAKTPGGRSGYNVAYLEDMGEDMERNPKRAVALLGDVNFLDYGGAVVFSDGSMDVIDPGEREGSSVVVHTIELEPLSSSAWWANSLPSVARTVDADLDELKASLASDDVKQRGASYYYALVAYHGAHEFDQYPVTLTPAQARYRYQSVLRRQDKGRI